MAYPYLPVNPCCTEVVLNSPCGCSSTIVNGGCNNPCGTNLTASSTIVYDGPALTCTTAEPCDTLNVILQKIDEIICNLLIQINSLNIQVNNITNQILIINNDITNIYNQLGECCTTTTSTSSSSTTTSTTTIHPCENFSLTNTGNTQVPIIITNCDTGEPEAIILNPGDTNICVVTDSPLTVPGTIIVTPNGPCLPPTSSTTTTTSSSTSTSTSSTTTTTTTAIPCECLTFENTDKFSAHNILYNDCFGNSMQSIISENEIINVCGCCGSADDPLVLITIGADCIDGLCPGISTTTTTSTTILPNCSFTGTANELPDATTTTTTTVCTNCNSDDITIGTQVWTGCNLNVDTYANGDPIPEVTDPTAWAALTTGAWCYYNNDSGNNVIYGKLYNWHAVNDPRGLAPTGYHVPTSAEWTTLTTLLGGETVAGGQLKESGLCHWETPNTGATNSIGFAALPGGFRSNSGIFQNINFGGEWWTSSENSSTYASDRQMQFNAINASSSSSLKEFGFSVRLIQD
jgi:uncharacterized protein (TIGR02145 family)